MNPLRLKEPFKSFIELKKSEMTREGYASDLDLFRKWLNDRGKTVFKATRDDLQAWVNWCRNHEKLKDRTITRKIAAISGLYRWLFFQKQIKEDPAIVFEFIDFEAAKRNPKPLSEDQREVLLKALKWDTLNQWRKSIFTLIGFYTGMRLNEIRNIKWNDINFETLEIQTVGKGAKKMTKQFNKELAGKLNEFKRGIEVINKLNLPDYLFYNPHCVSSPISKWNASRWARQVKKWCGWGAEVKYSSHSLRHDFCERLMNAGVPIEVTQELMGHSNIATTTMYYKAKQDTQKAAYKSAMEKK